MSKELDLYGKEAEDQSSKVQQLVAEGADEYDIKKQKEILRDCEQMVPDTRSRLTSVVADLDTFIVSVHDD
ncbi:unnamed protein product [Malassezia sympodialis ATCC 42132]|uniref:uncharacterized protein n=1 Tax=Malassezia sympodialis (strain ATCC 42132) TaxID=1230383 RepID=UPI0002C2AAC1|nr:uncharacterized protein MSY001_2798 [Malassezia sympodialis ATCC 42132]CCV00093.1 unnamed protein product [Malassezia sympodialis ATCC 42132]|eukprot:XP_018741302.1 uncharacterized protein MSY001_2798 [Malassezia sympodialis ATCC 42132]